MSSACTSLPLSKVKRIAKLDPNVHMVNNEATVALAAAAEAFIAALAQLCHRGAAMARRKTVHMRDFDDACKEHAWLDFLDGCLVGWDDDGAEADAQPADESAAGAQLDDNADTPLATGPEHGDYAPRPGSAGSSSDAIASEAPIIQEMQRSDN